MGTADFHAETVAQQALEVWGLQSARRKLVATRENIVFRVDPDDGQPLVLHLHRPGYHSLEELISERQWTHALSDRGISVPVPVQALDGRDYVLVENSMSGEARYAGITHWVEGKMLYHIISSSGDFAPNFRRLGRLAARMHNQASGWEPPSGFVRPWLDADGLMGLSPSPFTGPFWALPELTASERARLEHLRGTIHDRLLRLETGPVTYSMIHADLHPGNLVVNGERLHVIDFDDAAFGWHMYDLAVGVYHYQGDPSFPEIVDAVFEGYREIRPLDTESTALLPVFLLIRTLDRIGWLVNRPDVPRLGEARYLVDRALYLSAELGL